MSELEPKENLPPKGGERRRKDRRSGDRRGDERRTPPPFWRRPAAFIAYGVVGALLIMLFFRGGDDGVPDPAAEVFVAEPEVRPADLPVASGPLEPTREAFTLAQYERLIAEGEGAVGEIVRVELYCGSIIPVTVRESDRAEPALLALAEGSGRVAGAECRWSQEGRSSDFLLVVPADLAEEFARAPEVELNFVRRRRIPAHVEWLGRSEALSLRTAGVLREIRL